MKGRLRLAVVCGVSAWALAGCASQYTRAMSETHKEAKIAGKSFAILPVMDIDYQPPSSCFGSGDKADGSRYEGPWLSEVEKNLKAGFKTQTFKVYTPAELKELRIDAPSLYSSASDEIAAMGVHRVETNLDGIPMTYKTGRAGSVKPYLEPLHAGDSVDYVILLVQPKMTGQTQHNAGHYQAAPGGGGAFVGGGTVTTYTSDIQFGVWSAETGELVYASGAINASSGFCLFVSPQQASINGTATDITTQLKALIARILGQEPGALELGMSGTQAR